MAVTFIYSCPGTHEHPPHQFRFCHIPDRERDPLPRYCAVCSYDSQAETFTREMSAPHIEKSIRRAGDATFRQMEGQAEERMDMAAEMTGMDRGEFNDLKITDIKDNLREGDTADVTVNNDVSRAIEADTTNYGFRPQLAPMAGGGGGHVPDALGNTPLGYSSMTTQGPHAYAGAKAATMVGNYHRKNSHNIVAAGTEKSYSGKSS